MKPLDDAVRVAREQLDADHYRVRMTALYPLSQAGDYDAGPRIAALLDDGDYRIRAAALHAVATLRYRDAFPAVMALLEDREMLVRAAAGAALGPLDDRRAIDPLIVHLQRKGESEPVRKAVIQSLAALGEPGVRTAIMQELRPSAGLLQLDLIRALAAMPSPEVIDALVAVLDDVDDGVDVGALAAWTLGRIGDERALPALEYMAANDDGEHCLEEEGGLYEANAWTAELQSRVSVAVIVMAEPWRIPRSSAQARRTKSKS